MKNIISLLILTLSCLTAGAERIKVACVGNSVTYGYRLENRERDAYPVQLQRLLGDEYEVGNFGKSGATLLRHGHRPYNEQEECRAALDFGAGIAVIHLGLNDTDPRNWPNYRDEFETDYQQLIDALHAAAPGGHLKQLVICRMSPIFDGHPRFESGTRDWHAEIQQAIERVAEHNVRLEALRPAEQRTKVTLIDLFRPLHNRPDLFPDDLHPIAQGAGIIAKTVYGGLTGNWGGLALAPIYSDGMVIQHDHPALRGRANALETISIDICKATDAAATAKGKKKAKKQQPRPLQTVTVQADIEGHWTAQLAPLTPREAYTITIRATQPESNAVSKTITINDVLAGEVWLCSGQSNMAFRLEQSITAKEDIAAANTPLIRFYDMKERWATDNTEWPAESQEAVNNLDYYHPTRWTPCDATTAARFSAIGYHFGRTLADSLQMPVGLICNAIGGSTAESWIDRTTLEYEFPAILRDWQHNDFIQDWCRGRAAKNVAAALTLAEGNGKCVRHPYLPCYLYESGIDCLDAYPIKGVIWYQGESNAHNKDAHERLFSLLVDSWRKNWQTPTLPFHFVQLSSINRPSWPWFRDSQRRIAKALPHVDMAVSSDLGDSLDVHPRYKREVGQRLARLALHNDYGKTHVTASGPMPRSAEFTDGSVLIHFDNGHGLHAGQSGPIAYSGNRIATFEVAGSDGIFYPAEATAVKATSAEATPAADNTLIVKSDKVANPTSVRYGWQPFTRANLVNSDNLPATTFRLDKVE